MKRNVFVLLLSIGLFSSLSVYAQDSKQKDNTSDLDKKEVLKKVNQLNIQHWKYKGTENEYHIGPYADEFNPLFKVGFDGNSISTIDPSGVALIAIQALTQEVKECSKQNETLIKEIKVLKEVSNEYKDKIAEIESLRLQIEQIRNAQIECCKRTGNLDLATTLDIPTLEQNNPNPFNETTTIRYYLPQNTTDAQLLVNTVDGKELKRFKLIHNGVGQIILPADVFPTGTYYYSLIVSGKVVDTKKMVLLLKH